MHLRKIYDLGETQFAWSEENFSLLQYSWQHIDDPSSPWLVWGSNGNSMTLHLCLVLKTNEVSEKTLNFLYALGWWTVDAWIYAMAKDMCMVLYSLCGGDGRWGGAPNATSHIFISQKIGVVCYKIWNAKDETPKSLSMFKPPKHTKKNPHSQWIGLQITTPEK